MSPRADVIVLGAGMVGVSAALHLQRRGRDVVLIDRRDPGEETSYRNAGLTQRESVIPYTFPREFGVVLSYAMNNRRDAIYHLSALPRIAPWLFQYWRNASSERCERSIRALAPLMAQCVKEHDALIAEVGSAAQRLVNRRLAQLLPHGEDSAQRYRGRANARGIRRRLYGACGGAIAGARTAFVGGTRRSDPFPRLADLVRSWHAHEGLCRSLHPSGRTLPQGRRAPTGFAPLGLEPGCGQGLNRGP